MGLGLRIIHIMLNTCAPELHVWTPRASLPFNSSAASLDITMSRRDAVSGNRFGSCFAQDIRPPGTRELRSGDNRRATAESPAGWGVVPGTGVEPVRPVRAGGFYVPP